MGTYSSKSTRRVINLGKGRYRVVVKDKYGLIGGTSRTIRLRK